MRRLLMAVLLLGLAGVATAAPSTTNVFDMQQEILIKNSLIGPPHGGDGRVGGEDIATAVVIPAVPYTDTGNTCGHINDYDEACPYTGSTSPDVVYAYTGIVTVPAISINLCNSGYDTKVYVYEDVQGNLVACNDDANCTLAFRSKIDNMPVAAGHIYYIIVDGYGGACGDYQLDVTPPPPPCQVPCPAGALIEGEPTCQDNYVDAYNGGCNSTPPVFQDICPQTAGEATFCGKSCTYSYYGSSYRDTDWFNIKGAGGAIVYENTAEFPLLIFQLTPGCPTSVLQSATADPCVTASLTFTATPMQPWVIWAGPSVFTGVPESNYVIHLTGIACIPVATESTTWGAIKGLYR